MKKKKENINLIKRIIKDLLKPYSIVILIIICFILSAVIFTVTPKMSGEIITEIYNQLINKIALNGIMDFTIINKTLILLAVAYITYTVIEQIKNILIINISQTYITKLREKINDKILKLPVKYFNEKSNGEILSLITNDIGNLNDALVRVIREFITEFFNIIGACIMIYSISPKLIPIDIIIIIVSSYVIIFFARKSQKYFIEKQKEIGELNNNIEEAYSSRYTIEMFGNQSIIKDKFTEENKKLKNISKKAEFTASIAGSLLKFLENVSIAVIAIVSAILNLRGEIQIGYIYTIISYTTTLTNPFSKMGFITNELMNVLASSRRIYQFIDEKGENKDLKAVEGFKDKLLADTINFSYEKDKEILNNVNIVIPRGNKIAIVGRTGSGKTTLAKLLMHIYDVNSGKVEMDNTNINELDSSEYINNFNVITQDINLFTDTVMENIKYGNEKISEEEIIDIAKKLEINDVFMDLENGYETQISEANNNISAGIKQLIVLMQNVISDSPILVFDEATNMLDEDIQNKIENAMNYIRQNKTLIVIAHKLNTIKDADMIYVLNEGKIIECGTHEELMNNHGIYEGMYLNYK